MIELTCKNSDRLDRSGNITSVTLKHTAIKDIIPVRYAPNRSKKMPHQFGYWAVEGKRFNFIDGRGICHFTPIGAA